MLKSIGSQSQALSDCTELNREVSLFFPPHASKGKNPVLGVNVGQ